MDNLLENDNDYPEIDLNAQMERLAQMKHNSNLEMMENIKRRDALIEQFSHLLEGPLKDLNLAIIHFEEIYNEFSDIYVFGPLVRALKERKAPGDLQRAREIQEDHGVFIP
jgi:hypothetical protein